MTYLFTKRVTKGSFEYRACADNEGLATEYTICNYFNEMHYIYGIREGLDGGSGIHYSLKI